MGDLPSRDDIRTTVWGLVELSKSGWIGEGNEIADELLDYIDGDPDAFAGWNLPTPAPPSTLSG